MRTIQVFSLAIGLLLFGAVASADTIISTLDGGPWALESTWTSGNVPGSDDDVVIAGPVEITGTEACQGLTVKPTGYLQGAFAGPNNTLQVGGSVTNAGTIADGTFYFFLEVGGDLHNDGTWANRETRVTGTTERTISHGPEAGFDTRIVHGPLAAADLVATTPLTVDGDVDMTGGRLILQPDCPFTLDEGAFSGELAAGGNEMRFVSWSYLQNCSLDEVVLVGEVEASWGVVFTTSVTVQDTLQNLSASGGAVIYGDLINNGLIRNDNYGFPVAISGNLENNGSITSPGIEFTGDSVHHISMSPDAFISATLFLPEFQARTLIADTPLRLADGLGLGVGKLILEPGSSLRFTSFGGLGSGTVVANNNEISIDGTGGLGGVTIDRGVIADQVAVLHDVLFTNGVTVTGTITSWPWAAADITVEGLLLNEGTIRDGDHPVSVTALGDLQNLGEFLNSQVVLAGVTDQAVGAGPGISAAEFVLESNLQSPSYQWYRDGAPLPGETASNLTLATVGPAEYGSYQCAGDAGSSRTIIIAENLTTSDVPGAAATAFLEQNHPNPFNPATGIAFNLARSGPVFLEVFDLSGRRVAGLVEGNLEAGRHQVLWEPRDLPSGTYVYRLQADGVIQSRKCLLLK